MSCGDFEDDWEPLSQAEMKVIQAKQERSNKISKIMGDYLLKGYKMLASSCDDCGCILLQDKQSQLYCVACNECEVEGSKDDPALSQMAADSKIREGASPGAAASSSLEVGAEAASSAGAALSSSSSATPRSSSAGPMANGIPSLMNASPSVNGLNGGGAEAGGLPVSAISPGGISGGGGGGGVGGSGGGGKAPKGKASNRPGNRASTVGVRSLMSDVGRNAYEAFATYADDLPASPAAPAVGVASAPTPPPSSLPPHGPSVYETGSSSSQKPPTYLNGFVNSMIPVSKSPPTASVLSAMTSGRLAPSEHESLTQTLKRKLISAGLQLEKSGSNEEDKALCGLIKNYADALEAVNRMQNANY